MLWDLVHDRAHCHGDLPFDPFMIRQRMPYWMYSLEELRCDLTAFVEAVALEARGLRLRPPRPVRDPLRPAVPLPGDRLARAQLRRAGRPAAVRLPAPPRRRALDRQPAADRLGRASPTASLALRAEVEALYRDGHRPLEARPLGRAHDLVAELRRRRRRLGAGRTACAASPTSRTRGRYIDAVQDDEFPLSIFYTSLQAEARAAGLAAEPSVGMSAGRWTAASSRSRARRRPAGRVVVAGPGRRGASLAAGRPRRRQPTRRRRLRPGRRRVDTRRASTCSTRADARLGRGSRALRRASTASPHLVGGWRGGTPLEEAPLDDCALLARPAVPHRAAHVAGVPRRRCAPASAGASSLVSSPQAQAPDRRQRRLRGGQGGRRGVDARARRRARRAPAARRTCSSSTRSSRRRCSPATPTRPTGPSPTPRRSPRPWSSCAPTRARKMNGQRLSLPRRLSVTAASERASPATTTPARHPEVLAALAAANAGHAVSYGDDPVDRARPGDFRATSGPTRGVLRLQRHRRQRAGPEGAAAPWEAVISPATSHLNVDECGAPEQIGGLKLLAVPTPDGKLAPSTSRRIGPGRRRARGAAPGRLRHPEHRAGDASTRPDEIRARWPTSPTPTACCSTSTARGWRTRRRRSAPTCGAITTGVGVDLAVASAGRRPARSPPRPSSSCDPGLARASRTCASSTGSSPRRSASSSAQLEALLGDDLWRRSAEHANAMARRLAAGVADVPALR